MGDFFISPTGMKTLLSSGAPLVILDVRKRAAFDESGEMISGATWRDPFQISTWMSDLEANTRLIVHCVHGHEVSQLAAQTLRDSGFDARVLFGGIAGWQDAGGEVTPAEENEKART
jgi:rhodanese-related sulfurtransferase